MAREALMRIRKKERRDGSIPREIKIPNRISSKGLGIVSQFRGDGVT
jgi:hypothetical protein